MISIPIALLWHVQISLRRKVALCTVLCLSIFTIITAVIRIAGGNISQGQVDSAWVNFWEQAEAAVAIIVVSVSAFRALYVAHRASKQNSPFYPGFTSRSLWSKISKSRNNLPDVPSPSFTGVRTFVQRAPYGREILRDSPDMELPLRGSRIVVTRDVSTETVRPLRRFNEIQKADSMPDGSDQSNRESLAFLLLIWPARRSTRIQHFQVTRGACSDL